MIEVVKWIVLTIVELFSFFEEAKEDRALHRVFLDHSLFFKHCIDELKLSLDRGFVQNIQ